MGCGCNRQCRSPPAVGAGGGALLLDWALWDRGGAVQHVDDGLGGGAAGRRSGVVVRLPRVAPGLPSLFVSEPRSRAGPSRSVWPGRTCWVCKALATIEGPVHGRVVGWVAVRLLFACVAVLFCCVLLCCVFCMVFVHLSRRSGVTNTRGSAGRDRLYRSTYEVPSCISVLLGTR